MQTLSNKEAIDKEFAKRNFRRLKYLSLIFVAFSIYALITDFTTLFPWGADTQKKLQILDTLFGVGFGCGALLLWFAKEEVSRLTRVVSNLLVVFLIFWVIGVTVIDYSSFSFSTYSSALILLVLFLNLRPIPGLLMIWGSAFLLVASLMVTDQLTEESFASLSIIIPLLLILSIVSVKGYREQVSFLNAYFMNQELTTQLEKARNHLQDEVDRQTRELVVAKEQAEASDRLKSAFLINMSHEIRTPMNGILGFQALLKEVDFGKDEKEEFLSIVDSSSNRLLSTLEDIIQISKIHSGDVEITTEKVDMPLELSELHSEFTPLAQQKGLDFTITHPVNPIPMVLELDKEKTRVVFRKIFHNAIKFTPKGSVCISYGIKKGDHHSELEICIRDTGIGILESRIDRIFNSFEKGDIEDVQVYEGSGLGLAISKSYIEMLQGRIEVESIVGKGSTFRVYLPMSMEEKNS